MCRVFLLALSASVALLGCPTAAPPCSATTCATGCCDTAGRCQPGTGLTACGLGGRACLGCAAGQTCLQGQCSLFSTGGGTATGANGLEVFPPSATVAEFESLRLSARVDGGVDAGVIFSLVSGPGSTSTVGPLSARYHAQGSGLARVQAAVVGTTSQTQIVDITIAPISPFRVVPNGSSPQLTFARGSRQSFAALRSVRQSTTPFASSTVGVASLEWRVWPAGTIDGSGTLTADDVATESVYAREVATNQWSAAEVTVRPTATFPAIAISPSLATVSRGGVVQFTATVSTGEAVSWDVVTTDGGTITATGTYTAPGSAGVVVVNAVVGPTGPFLSGNPRGYATVIVQ